MSRLPRTPDRISVAVLCGGISSEDYLSRRSSTVVAGALRRAGFQVDVLDWDSNGQIRLNSDSGSNSHTTWSSLADCFSHFRPDVVFNALHGESENAGQLQGFFELVGIPVTGHGLVASVLGMDKLLSKHVFASLRITQPSSCELGYPGYLTAGRAVERFTASGMDYPVMLKSAFGGSSGALELVETESSFVDVWNRWCQRPDLGGYRTFAEEYIDGLEYSLGIFGHWRQEDYVLLPVVGIEFDGPYFDKDTKFTDRYRVNCVHELTQEVQSDMRDATVAVHYAMRFSGFSRMDFRVAANRAYALEVNTHPGLAPASIIPNSLSCSMLTMEEAVSQMVEWSLAPP